MPPYPATAMPGSPTGSARFCAREERRAAGPGRGDRRAGGGGDQHCAARRLGAQRRHQPLWELFGDWLRRGGATVADVIAAPATAGHRRGVCSRRSTPRPASTSSRSFMPNPPAASSIPLPEIARLAQGARRCRRGRCRGVVRRPRTGRRRARHRHRGHRTAEGARRIVRPFGRLRQRASAWRLIDRPDAPVQSTLSLIDLKRDWLDAGRGACRACPLRSNSSRWKRRSTASRRRG